MPGMKCPKCGKLTFFSTPTGKKCTSCDYEVKTFPGPGPGQKCPICGKRTFFNGKCRSCGAREV